MSSIVVIMSSPRKDGNSSTIAKYMAEGAMGLSTNIIETYNLNDMINFRGCDHCDCCKKTGACVIKDDMTKVLDAIEKCDALIVATPLYFGRSNSLLEVLIDRMYYTLDGNFKPRKTRESRFAPIITYDYDVKSAQELYDGLRATFEGFGFKPSDGIIFYGNGKNDAARNDERIQSAAYALGHEIGS